MKKMLLLLMVLSSCVSDQAIRSSYIDINVSGSEMTVTNVFVDPVYVFIILEEDNTTTIPPSKRSTYRKMSFNISRNATKKFKFSKVVKVRYLRTCLIVDSSLKFCRNDSF